MSSAALTRAEGTLHGATVPLHAATPPFHGAAAAFHGCPLSPTDEAGAVGLFGDADAEGVVGEELLDELGPLDEAEAA